MTLFHLFKVNFIDRYFKLRKKSLCDRDHVSRLRNQDNFCWGVSTCLQIL